MGKGGVSAREKISRRVASISTSPVGSLGFWFPPRSATVPSMPMQYSPRSSPASGELVGADVEVAAEDHLGHAVAIAQVDEDRATVVATIPHPAAQHDLLADVRRAQLAAGMGLLTLMQERGHGTVIVSSCRTASSRRTGLAPPMS
jgi:hypothetical protein